MENFQISQTADGLHIEGFPDAVKVVAIYGDEAKKLADLALHKADLEFSDSCLDLINKTGADNHIVREALWRSAIIHFVKCFGTGARVKLVAGDIYADEPEEALMAFDYFENLRDKHVVHDVNSYAQSVPGAIINNGEKDYKIEKIVCLSVFGVTLEQDNFSNLSMLVRKAKEWVIAEYDKLCEEVSASLENEPYSEVAKRESVQFKVPELNEIGKKKKL
jgi:hypothetical protein